MAYIRQNFEDFKTIVNAENFRHIEDGIIANEELISASKSNAQSVSWDELRSFRDSGVLIPGRWYRITDYAFTTTQTDTMSAGHAFDILVMATETDRLSEIAHALPHTGDSYFEKCKMEAWELRYCLDNDTERFLWADTENGKGVIYWMKDEFHNECPYDFKNALFRRYRVTDEQESFLGAMRDDSDIDWVLHPYWGISPGTKAGTIFPDDFKWFFTFSDLGESGDSIDKSLFDIGSPVWGIAYNSAIVAANNIIKETYAAQIIDDDKISNPMILNNIVICHDNLDFDPAPVYGVYNNFFGVGCSRMTIGKKCNNNVWGAGCTDIYVSSSLFSSSFGLSCHEISISPLFICTSFGNNSGNIAIKDREGD